MRNRKIFGSPFLTETLTYQNLVIAAGGSLNNNELVAVNEGIKILQASSAWTNIKELWIPLGSNLASALVKIKTSTAQTSQIAVSLIESNYSRSLGLNSNGSGYLTTGFVPSVEGLTYTNISCVLASQRTLNPTGVHLLTCSDPTLAIKFGITDTISIGGFSVGGASNIGCKGFNSPSEIWHTNSITSSTGFANVTYNNEIEIFRSRYSNSTYIANNIPIHGYCIGSQMTKVQMQSINMALQLINLLTGRITQDKYSIVFGDSIASGSAATSYANSYAMLIAANEGLVSFNLSQAGRTLVSVDTSFLGLDSLYQDYIDGIINKIKKVHIQIGINDFRGNCGYSSDALFSEYIGIRLTNIVNYLISKGVLISDITIGNLVRTTEVAYSQLVGRYNRYNNTIKKVCFDLGVKYATVYENFVTNNIIASDGIHPGDNGHSAIFNEHINAIVPTSVATDPTVPTVLDNFTRTNSTGLGTANVGTTYNYFDNAGNATSANFNIVSNLAILNNPVNGEISRFGQGFTSASNKSVACIFNFVDDIYNGSLELKIYFDANTYITVIWFPAITAGAYSILAVANGVTVINSGNQFGNSGTPGVDNILGVDWIGDGNYIVNLNRKKFTFTVSAGNDTILQTCNKFWVGERNQLAALPRVEFKKVWVRPRNY